MLVKRSRMGVAHVCKRIMAVAAGASLLLSLSLGGCATSTAGSSGMDARAQAGEPSETLRYLPVDDRPPPREGPVLTPDERAKILNELIAARDRQGAKAKEGAERSQPINPKMKDPE